MSRPSYPTISRRRLLQAGGGCLLAAAAPALQAQINGLAEAINKAGRQRMLSQRLAKAWLAMGQGIDAPRAERVLHDSMALFDRQLIELKAFAPTAGIRASYAALEPVWSEYKSALIGRAPARTATPELIALDARVLQLAQQGTLQLEQHSGRTLGQLVNLAGRQRMLSQRTAKFFLVQAWQVPVPEAQVEFERARREFVQALARLEDAPEANASIRGDLQLARQQWVFFENALERGAEGRAGPQRAAQVFSTSENILNLMDRVTEQYVRLAA